MTPYQLAPPDAQPPTAASYWVVPGLFLAGGYPGDPDPVKHRAKVRALVDAGVRVFISLMEKDETNHQGEPFVPYEEIAQEFCRQSACVRYAVRDLKTPAPTEMTAILDALDERLTGGTPVYLHCWGGVGRTGTVVACWLLRHGLASRDTVLEVLARLRQQDRERGYRVAPESERQRRFVLSWPPAAD